MINIFQIVFFDSMFLALTDEKVRKKRSTTEKIMLIHQRIQIINFLKSLDLTRKMRNVIKLFCAITNRRTIYSLSILMIAYYIHCHSFHKELNPGNIILCTSNHLFHHTILLIHGVTSEFCPSVTPVPPGNLWLFTRCTRKTPE